MESRWCPFCKTITRCAEHGLDVGECNKCGNTFNDEYERRALFHYLWGLNIICCRSDELYNKREWARLGTLIDHAFSKE